MDGDKFFVVSWGNTESRYNPNFHRGLGYSLTGWGKLGRIAAVKGGKRIPLGDIYANEDTGFHYLRVDNIGANGAIVGEMKWLTKNTYKTLERYRIFSGDVLISIAGTIGRIAVFDESNTNAPTILTENCAKLHIGEDVLPEYLMLLLLSRPLQKQMARDYIQTTIPKLGLDRIRQLRLPPILKVTAQKQVIASWHLEWEKFLEANLKATHLLDSIDNYLLNELGITLPHEPDNTLVSRIFTSQRSELAGWRFDPYYFGAKFYALEHGLDYGPYPAVSLVHLYLSINNGVDCREFITDGLPYVKVADVKPFAADLIQAETVPADSIPERGLVKKGDLLLTRKGTFGVAALVETDTKFAISSEVFRIELDTSKVLGSYLVTVLNSSICQEQFDRQKIGMIMGSLTQVSLRRIRLPLPPLEKQREIQTYASEVRQSAALLILQAQTELESAKRRIEAMLLGESA